MIDRTVKRDTKLTVRRAVWISASTLAVLVAARVVYVGLVVFPRERLEEAAAADVAADAAFKKKLAGGRALIDKTQAQMRAEAQTQESPNAAKPKAHVDARTDKYLKENADWLRSHGLPENATDIQIGRALAFDVCKMVECKDVPPEGK